MRSILHLFLLLLFAAPVAAAQFIDSLQLTKAINVTVTHRFTFDASDDSDRCAPTDADALVAEAELVLRRAGITVVDQGYDLSTVLALDLSDDQRNTALINQPFVLDIGLVGVLLRGQCAIAYQYELFGREETSNLQRTAAIPGAVVVFESVGVWTGDPSLVMESMRSNTRDEVTKLANEILKARQ